MKKRAFTVIELMVVLAIIALLSALIFGAISSVREGNKRGSCQGNLNAIYAAARLYGQDNDGQFPYRYGRPTNNSSLPVEGGLGLWALYVYEPPRPLTFTSASLYAYKLPLPLSSNDAVIPAPTDVDQRRAATLASYLKAPRAFHCPSDNSNGSDEPIQYNLANGDVATITVPTSQFEFVGADNRRHLNPSYLSYQVLDPNPVYSSQTYSTYRGAFAGSTYPDPALTFKRQIGNYVHPTDTSRRAPDQTVVTWCHFHRSLDSGGNVKSPGKTFDNVLFLDGSVQSVPVEQTVTLSGGSASAICRGWKRVPLAEANAVPQYVIDACNASP